MGSKMGERVGYGFFLDGGSKMRTAYEMDGWMD